MRLTRTAVGLAAAVLALTATGAAAASGPTPIPIPTPTVTITPAKPQTLCVNIKTGATRTAPPRCTSDEIAPRFVVTVNGGRAVCKWDGSVKGVSRLDCVAKPKPRPTGTPVPGPSYTPYPSPTGKHVAWPTSK